MDYIKCNKPLQKFAKLVDASVSLLMFLGIVGVVLFIGYEIYMMFVHLIDFNAAGILHTVALTLVLVKAYRLLLFYMQSHHVSIRYIIEISIIAPAVELIFSPSGRDIWMNIVYAIFAIVNLLIYVFNYSRLTHIDDEELNNPDEIS